MIYKQCELTYNKVIESFWIPEALAKPGKHIKVNDEAGYQIHRIGRKQTESYVLAHDRAHKGMRQINDGKKVTSDNRKNHG